MNTLFFVVAILTLAAAYSLGFIHGAKRTYRIYEKEKESELIEKHR
jgi:hypothetical protein